MLMRKLKWYRSIGFQAIALPILFLAALGAGIALVMSTKGKSLVLQESTKRIEQSGSSVVLYLSARLGEIGALTRTLAEVAERLPKTEASFHEMVPPLLDFQGDRGVAGGGVWPEPFAFKPEAEKRSFFWGRDGAGAMRYFDDYNGAQGYHREAWYAVARHLPEGGISWSESYMDPFSRELMVTCTAPTYERGAFTGAVTVDLKLSGLQAFADEHEKQTGGYLFIVDRNNRFITFPEPARARRASAQGGEVMGEFLTASELASGAPLFAPIAAALDEMNRDIVDRARRMPGYRKTVADDPDLAAANAELIAAMMADPLEHPSAPEKSYRKIALKDDFILGEPSAAYVFNVPGVYWKVVMVKPDADATRVATDISHALLLYILATTLAIIAASFYGVRRLIVDPLRSAIRSVQQMGARVATGRVGELERHTPTDAPPNELGLLAQVLRALAGRIVEQNRRLEDYSHNLEEKVDRRTSELAQATEEAHTAMEKSERLLLNILPQPIAERLKQGQRTIADSFEEVTVLFADIVGFTPLSSGMPAEELVGMMNVIFSAFDRLTEKHNLEKIKTIGDAYMAVGGLPVPLARHAQAAAEMALDMAAVIERFAAERGMRLSLRIGINTGPVVAGIIGEKKFSYDLWGDTVNTASRMESHGLPNSIQVAEATYSILKDDYVFECRGAIQVKGKGEMMTYMLVGRRNERHRAA